MPTTETNTTPDRGILCPRCLEKGVQTQMYVYRTRSYRNIVTRERRCRTCRCIKITTEK